MLRLIPSLRGYAEPLTNAMVEFYLASQEHFTQDMQPHYVYSPREMTRWVRGICEAMRFVLSALLCIECKNLKFNKIFATFPQS